LIERASSLVVVSGLDMLAVRTICGSATLQTLSLSWDNARRAGDERAKDTRLAHPRLTIRTLVSENLWWDSG